jgi:hypothetical protein
MSFWKYHLLHHGHLNEVDFDTDVPGPTESQDVGGSSMRKTLWLAAFALVVGTIRPRRLAKVPFLDAWTVVNVVIQGVVVAALVMMSGWDPVKYLLVSALLAVGLHPLGARWIQEHYVFAPGQETYSYYGPLNAIAFNSEQRASRPDDDSVVAPAARARVRAGVLRSSARAPVVDPVAADVPGRQQRHALQSHRANLARADIGRHRCGFASAARAEHVIPDGSRHAELSIRRREVMLEVVSAQPVQYAALGVVAVDAVMNLS